ncbi:unnamed protein product [Alopecurus aequalis]
MGETAATTEDSLAELRSSLDLLHGAVARIDTAQQQMRAQMDAQALAVQEGSRLQDATARTLAKLADRLDANERGCHSPASPEEDDPDPEVIQSSDTTVMHTVKPNWKGNTAGAGTSAAAARGSAELGGGVGDGVLGGGVGDGLLGGGVGAGGGRPGSHHSESSGRTPLPKMSVPRFDGEWPRIWKDQIMDYFCIFNINPALWLTTGTLHLDGQAAMWWQAYKLQHVVTTWPQFILAIEEQFGQDDHRKVMKTLVNLKQIGTVAEYQKEFQELVFKATMLNHHYDEHMFIAHFIRGLKSEFRAAVESQAVMT